MNAKQENPMSSQDESKKQEHTHSHPERPVPKVLDVVGSALPKIGVYKKLNSNAQVVALINDVSYNKIILESS